MAITKAITFTKVGDTFSETETVFSSGSAYHKVTVSVTLTAIDEKKMTATVSETLKLSSKYVAWSQVDKYFSLWANGSQLGDSVHLTKGGSTSGSTTPVNMTRTATLKYNSDGTLSVPLVGKITGEYSTYDPDNTTITFNATFPKIAVQSEFELSGGTKLGDTINVAITRQLDTFTHKVEYSFAGNTFNAISDVGTSTSINTSLDWGRYIPNTTSGTLTVKVTTFEGDTQIGSPVTDTLQLDLPSSVVPTMSKPTVTHSSANSVVNSWGLYVKGYSKAIVAMKNITPAVGTTIASYSISGGGFTSSSDSLDTGVLNKAETVTFICTITDSRGRTATDSVSITVEDYNVPTVEIKEAYRCNSSGTKTDDGTYLRIMATHSDISIPSKNTLTKTVSCNGVTSSFTSGTPFTFNANASVDSNYTLTVTVTDALGNSSTDSVNIPNTGALPLHIKGNKKGIGLGTVASADSTIEIGWTVDLNGNKINGLLDLVYPVGSIYMSVNSASPATLFGGVWEAIGGRFLVGVDSTYTGGKTGGAATVTLKNENLPSHTHNVGAHSHDAGTLTADNISLTGSWGSNRARFPGSNTAEGIVSSLKGSRDTYWTDGGSKDSNTYGFSVNASHEHTVSGSTANSAAFDTGATGSGTAHENLPPYLAVYMWERKE